MAAGTPVCGANSGVTTAPRGNPPACSRSRSGRRNWQGGSSERGWCHCVSPSPRALPQPRGGSELPWGAQDRSLCGDGHGSSTNPHLPWCWSLEVQCSISCSQTSCLKQRAPSPGSDHGAAYGARAMNLLTQLSSLPSPSSSCLSCQRLTQKQRCSICSSLL